jgi:TM2 domain-containing membrane protein YozV
MERSTTVMRGEKIMNHIFISYSKRDRDRAQRLAETLRHQGLSVWWDDHIPAGMPFDEAIEQALKAARCVVVLWSESSVKSRWVREEASKGKDRGILVPVLLDDVEIPIGFSLIQAVRLTGWPTAVAEAEFNKLLQAIHTVLQSSADSEEEDKAQPLRALYCPPRPKSPTVAAFLSFLLPGLGQMYLGQRKKGAFLFGLICLSSLLTLGAGWVLGWLTAIDAYLIGNRMKQGFVVAPTEYCWQNGNTMLALKSRRAY